MVEVHLRSSQRGMSTFAVSAVVASLGLGAAGSVVAYRSVAGPAVETTPAPALAAADDPGQAAAPVAEASPRVRFAPCTPPAVLEGRACVTDVVETVVVPPPAVAAAPAAGTARRAAARSTGGAGDDGSGERRGPGRDRDDQDDRDDRDDRDDQDEREDRDDQDERDEREDRAEDERDEREDRAEDEREDREDD